MNDLAPADTMGDESALRRAALTLHALGHDDRAWLLAKLPVSQRDELERLLAELQALGIPVERRLARTALKAQGTDRTVAAAAVAAPVARAGRIDFLDAAHTGPLAQLLQHEPASLIAHVVGLRGAAGEAMLEHLAAPKRRQVQELLSSPRAGATAPRLTEALIEQLSARLAPGTARQTPSGLARSFVKRWRSRWARQEGSAA